MRRKLIAGNWKMNLDRDGALQLAVQVQRGAVEATVDVAIFPPFVFLDPIARQIDLSAVGLGAQDVYFEPSGAFTGAVGGSMLRSVGCIWVIIGHSERRQLFAETDALVNRKAMAAISAGLTPIVCVGEKLDERQAGRTREVVLGQCAGSLENISVDQMRQIVIAYEPVWAIGTGKVATGQQAEEVHADLRNFIQSRYNSEIADRLRILYGGSVKPENAAELFAQPNIDGALVGGASLNAQQFLAIVQAASRQA